MGMCLMLSSAVTMKMMKGKDYKEIDICYFKFNNTFFAIDYNFDDKPSKLEYQINSVVEVNTC